MSIDAKPSFMRNDGSSNARGFRLPQSQLRLPAYRSSHLRRYHPYPRAPQYRFTDHWDLTSTSNGQSTEERERTLRHTLFNSDVDEGDISLLSLGPPQVDYTVNEFHITERLAECSPDKTFVRSFGFVELVIDLAFTMRQKFLNRNRSM